MNKPKISIITAVFNREKDLKTTLDNLREQTSKDYELIVIDGASTDNTVDVIKKNEDLITYWKSEKDIGVYNAMNKGVKKAKGEYLFFLNAGDYFVDEDVLENVSNQFDNKDLVYGSVIVYWENSEKRRRYVRWLNRFTISLGLKVSQQAVFIKRDVFNEVGGLDERYKIASDFDLLCKVFKGKYNTKRISNDIVMYQREGLSSDLETSYQDTGRVIKEQFGMLNFYAFTLITIAVKLIAKVLNY